MQTRIKGQSGMWHFCAVVLVTALATEARVCARQQTQRDAEGARWHAGQWDSSLYAWTDPLHPRTVGVRIETVDSRTSLPIDGTWVKLRGEYQEERMGIADDLSQPRVQVRDFELAAFTGRDGVVVFALSWQKEFPWSHGRPLVRDPNSVGESLSGARSWIRPVDDIEKVQTIETRHPQYVTIEAGLDFSHLLEFGQDRSTELQNPKLFEQFRLGWQGEINSPAVRFCALRGVLSGSSAPEMHSDRPGFFQAIRRKEFGNLYDRPTNLSSLRTPEFAGPYFVYLIQLALDPARQEIVVTPPPRTGPHAADPSPTSREDRRSAESNGDRDRRDAERRRLEAEARRAEHERQMREQAQQTQREHELQNQAEENAFGIAVSTLTASRRQELGLYPGTGGVVIDHLAPSGAAANAGLRENDVIESVLHTLTPDSAAFGRRVTELKSGDQVLVEFWRQSGGKWERAKRIIALR